MREGLILSVLLIQPCIPNTLVFAELSQAPTDQEYEIEARNRLYAIDDRDGIDRNEAEVIFEVYGYRFFLNSGWGPLTDEGENWSGAVLDHRSDRPLQYKVTIDKKTGAVSWEAGPDVLNCKVLLDTQPNNRFEYAPHGAGPR